MALTDEWIDSLYINGTKHWIGKREIARAIESAACAERDARIAELTTERDEWKHEAMHGGNAQYLREKVAELERQLAEARKDAERYRWLRDVAHPDYGPAVAEHQCNDWGKWYYAFPSSTELDAAIDNAMQKG